MHGEKFNREFLKIVFKVDKSRLDLKRQFKKYKDSIFRKCSPSLKLNINIFGKYLGK